MTLHGPIKVNRDTIGDWRADRIAPALDPDGTARYQCFVTMYADQPPRVDVFTVQHRYDEGALVLASTVLAEAVKRRREQGR